MGKKSGSAPAAPDYATAAAITAAGNAQAVKEQTAANRVDQYNPWGSITWNQDPSGHWTQTESLTPDAQAALQSQIDITNGRSQAAQGMLGSVQNAYSQPFNAPDFNSYLQGVNAVDQSRQGSVGPFWSNAQVQNQINTSGVNQVNQNGVNTGPVPTYTNDRQDQYSKAAYDKQMALLQPGLDASEQRQRNSLALQGLTPDSEASRNSMQEFNTGKNQLLSSVANQAVLTGSQMNNADYASQLAGNNQSFGQALQNLQAQNAGQGQAYSQAASNGTFANQAAAERYQMDSDAYKNRIAGGQLDLQQQQAANNAQQQAYNQATNTYGTNWQQAQTLRNMPLNELNALLYGQQIQNPTFQNYALQGYAPGADYLGAAQATGQYNTNLYNAGAANNSSMMGSLGSLAGGLFGAAGQAGGFGNLFSFSDKRLKDDPKKVGETPGGSNIYMWKWNDLAKKHGLDKAPPIGVIAQENPHAAAKVTSGPKKGLLMVDYSKIH